MEVVTYDSSVERIVLAGLLTNAEILSAVSRFYKHQPFLFRADTSNEIAKYAVTYFHQYGTVPPTSDVGLFVQKSPQDIKDVLTSLPDPPTNPQRVIDQADKLFQKIHWERHVDSLKDALNRDNLTACHQLHQAFHRVSTNVTIAVDPFSQPAIVDDAYSESSHSLLRFDTPDEAAFFQDVFARDTFVAFLGAEKSSKSFHIFHIGYQALRTGLHVAHFECGDLSQRQVIRRIAQRTALIPRKASTVKYPISFEVKKPEYAKNSELEFVLEYEPREFSAGLSNDVANQIFAAQSWYNFANPQYKLVCRPTRTLSVPDIDTILDEWSMQGWNPDFILIDYADILANTSKHTEVRHQIDDIWGKLRSLSQKWHCCVVTATQATSAAIKATHLTEEHVSEAKVKKAYVTSMLGVHATEWEAKHHVKKLNKILDRGDEASPTDPMYEATCLPFANPCVIPFYARYRADNSILPRDYFNVQALVNLGFSKKQMTELETQGWTEGFGDYCPASAESSNSTLPTDNTAWNADDHSEPRTSASVESSVPRILIPNAPQFDPLSRLGRTFPLF